MLLRSIVSLSFAIVAGSALAVTAGMRAMAWPRESMADERERGAMLRRFLLVGIASFLGVSVADPADVSGPSPRKGHEASSPDGAGAFASRKYRNLFAEAGHSEVEIDARIARAWKQLFEGDPKPSGSSPRAAERERPARLHPRHPAHGRPLRGHVVRDDDRGPARPQGRVRRALELVGDAHVPERPEAPGLRLLLVADGVRRERHRRAARPGRRGVLRDGALLRRAPLGQRQGHLRLQGARRSAAPRHGPPRRPITGRYASAAPRATTPWARR